MAYNIVDLLKVFLQWKMLLSTVVFLCPSIGYDTSTDLLLELYGPRATSPAGIAMERLVMRLTRWDALYFTTSSTRGHVYEQEWAFSWALARVIDALATVSASILPLSPIVVRAVTGSLLATVSHLFAVIALYHLVLVLLPNGDSTKRKRLAFLCACLHIISPAGIFLSAPYGESSFALTQFLGLYCYVRGLLQRHKSAALPAEAAWIVAAGACFALSAMIRSNGLLSGLIFVYDELVLLPRVFDLLRSRGLALRLITTVTAGMLLALGFALPQFIAYQQYCTATEPLDHAAWCTRMPPSIYSYVQSHYWNVGFFKYWTLPNLPLFLLAAPLIGIMVYTALPALVDPLREANRFMTAVGEFSAAATQRNPAQAPSDATNVTILKALLPRLALPQLVLVLLAATSFHVQIINRLASGYPLWYMSLTLSVCSLDSSGQKSGGQPLHPPSPADTKGGQQSGKPGASDMLFRLAEPIVRASVAYAIIQGGLYAAFLPPA